MSLFNLIQQSVVVKFADSAKPLYDSSASLVYRLTGVDGMGFLELQQVRIGADGQHEGVGTPVWVNKDLVLELEAFGTGKTFPNLRFSGPTLKAKPATDSANGAIKAPKPRSVKPKASPAG
jgi:hypothetical protein